MIKIQPPQKHIAAIDPGKSGACALWWNDEPEPWVYDTPIEDGDYSAIGIGSIGGPLGGSEASRVFIETPMLLAKNGTKTAFAVGRGIGMWEMAFAGVTKIIHVTPKEWQCALTNIPLCFGNDIKLARSKAIKERTAKYVLSIWPEAPIYTPRGRLIDGRSDALGILFAMRAKW
jgi:hypothetical protein